MAGLDGHTDAHVNNSFGNSYLLCITPEMILRLVNRLTNGYIEQFSPAEKLNRIKINKITISSSHDQPPRQIFFPGRVFRQWLHAFSHLAWCRCMSFCTEWLMCDNNFSSFAVTLWVVVKPLFWNVRQQGEAAAQKIKGRKEEVEVESGFREMERELW